ncbi:hypothetical protein VTI28DRAFT_2393 [Corynascus sepedonium]
MTFIQVIWQIRGQKLRDRYLQEPGPRKGQSEDPTSAEPPLLGNFSRAVWHRVWCPRQCAFLVGWSSTRGVRDPLRFSCCALRLLSIGLCSLFLPLFQHHFHPSKFLITPISEKHCERRTRISAFLELHWSHRGPATAFSVQLSQCQTV